MDWNTVTEWTDELVRQFVQEHPRDDGNTALAVETLEADIAADEECVRVRSYRCLACGRTTEREDGADVPRDDEHCSHQWERA